MKITITLPADRRQLGVLLVDDPPFECRCLGLADSAAAFAHGNPKRDPLKHYGDTPLGSYEASLGGVMQPRRSYGPDPVVILHPSSGDAEKAALAGRSGLLIHGGDPAADGKSLRPTHGCIRVDNSSQKQLVEMICGHRGSQQLTKLLRGAGRIEVLINQKGTPS